MTGPSLVSSVQKLEARTQAEPRLPQEIERPIFELAARSSRTKGLPALMLVALRVRQWLQPLLYEVIILTGYGRKPAVPMPPYPVGDQLHHVRYLLLDTGQTISQQYKRSRLDYRDLVSQCPNLQDLCIWRGAPPDILSQLITIQNSPHRTISPPGTGLFRLSAVLTEMFPERKVDFNHEALKNLTHLEVLDDGGVIYWKEGNNYSCLKQLQYLAFSDYYTGFPISVTNVKKCLTHCKSLKVLIIDAGHPLQSVEYYAQLASLTRTVYNPTIRIEQELGLEMETVAMKGVPEDRIVVTPRFDNSTWPQDWFLGVEGGDDMWTRAEKTVEQRRAGE